MKVRLENGYFVAEGDPSDCAIWAYTMLIIERMQQEKKMEEASKKEAGEAVEWLNRTFNDLLKKEREEEE